MLNFNRLKELSGSGFNFERIDIKLSGRIDHILSYHVMNSDGYYCGYVYFRIVALHHDNDFKLHFIGKNSQYLNRKFFLRDFLEDTVYESMQDQGELS